MKSMDQPRHGAGGGVKPQRCDCAAPPSTAPAWHRRVQINEGVNTDARPALGRLPAPVGLLGKAPVGTTAPTPRLTLAPVPPSVARAAAPGRGPRFRCRHGQADPPPKHNTLREGFASRQTGGIPSFPDFFPSCSASEGNHSGVLSSLTALAFSSQSLSEQRRESE